MFKKIICILLVIFIVGCHHQSSNDKQQPQLKEETIQDNQSKKLYLKGTQIVDKQGNNVQLKGLSTHGLSWFPEYVTKETFQSLKEDFQINTIRLAMYTEEYNGYCSGDEKNREELKQLIDRGVQYAKELDMYVIIDWHILSDGNPLKNIEESKKFFGEMAQKYKDEEHILYEICNEPNQTSWQEIETYAKEIIPIIRKYNKDALIIVGTPNWSQEVDTITKLDDQNILYALHFYADTHKEDLRLKFKTALDKGIPIFVSEFGICDASGNGSINKEEATKWLNLLDENHVSYVAWNISHKSETSAIFNSQVNKTSGFLDDDYSESGKWLKDYFTHNEVSSDKKNESLNNGDIEIIVNKENSWQENQKNMAQWVVSIDNHKETISDWTIQITFDNPFEVSQYWNFEYQIDGNTLIMKPTDYNQEIKINETIGQLGMILKSDNELKVKSAIIK